MLASVPQVGSTSDWKGRFYPRELPNRAWLEHYAARFATVEVNNTFYRLPPRDTFVAWAARLPDDFVVTVKASRTSRITGGCAIPPNR